MQDVEFSDEFCRFIQGNVPAVNAAELMLLLARRPGASYSVDEAVAKLGPGVAAPEAEKFLDLWVASGIVRRENARYRYNAQSEHAAHVSVLSLAYEKRPVTLVRVIYALRDSKIQSFAEAFRLRK